MRGIGYQCDNAACGRVAIVEGYDPTRLYDGSAPTGWHVYKEQGGDEYLHTATDVVWIYCSHACLLTRFAGMAFMTRYPDCDTIEIRVEVQT